MVMNIYAIKDRATNAFMTPFFMHTHGQAIRAFTDNINDPKSSAGLHPEDYDLWHLGSWDDSKGTLNQVEAMNQIAIGKNVAIAETRPHAHFRPE